MPRAKFARKPGDLSSGTTPKRRDITDNDRRIVLDNLLAGKSLLDAGREANVHWTDALAIAGLAGWSDAKGADRAPVEAARDRYAAAATA